MVTHTWEGWGWRDDGEHLPPPTLVQLYKTIIQPLEQAIVEERALRSKKTGLICTSCCQSWRRSQTQFRDGQQRELEPISLSQEEDVADLVRPEIVPQPLTAEQQQRAESS